MQPFSENQCQSHRIVLPQEAITDEMWNMCIPLGAGLSINTHAWWGTACETWPTKRSFGEM